MSFNYQSSCIVESFNYLKKKKKIVESFNYLKKKKKLLNLSTINQFKVVSQASIIISMSERLYINSAKKTKKEVKGFTHSKFPQQKEKFRVQLKHSIFWCCG
jgi:hypothetical protein